MRLMKPQPVFAVLQGRELQLTAGDRVGVYRTLASYMKVSWLPCIPLSGTAAA